MAKKPRPFDGMTVSKCPAACTADKCVISGINVCAHPMLGGLQAALAHGDALARFNDAKKMLGARKLGVANA